MGEYFRPGSLNEALALLAARRPALLAGGTDLYAGPNNSGDLLDLTGLSGLRTIEARADHWWIPCQATWTEMISADLPPAFDALKQAARQVGGRQVQNTGTLVGNLCNASPAADGVPCLMALGARVELASEAGRRSLKLDDFILGPRRTARRPDEMVLGLTVPRDVRPGRSCFVKLGARRYLVISIVSIAANGWYEAGRLAQIRLVVGACSAVPVRLHAAEAAILAGKPLEIQHLDPIAPIDDVRATADYRRQAALELLRRTYEYFV